MILLTLSGETVIYEPSQFVNFVKTRRAFVVLLARRQQGNLIYNVKLSRNEQAANPTGRRADNLNRVEKREKRKKEKKEKKERKEQGTED